MIHCQRKKRLWITTPAAIIDNAAATTTAVDTNGFDYAEIVVGFGTMDIAVTTMKVQTSDTDGSYADVTGLVYGTSTNTAGSASTLPAADADGLFFSFFIDLRKVKRFLDLSLTLGDGSSGTYVCAWIDLWRAEDMPHNAATRGHSQELMV